MMFLLSFSGAHCYLYNLDVFLFLKRLTYSYIFFLGSNSSTTGAQQGAPGTHPGVGVAGSGNGTEDEWEWWWHANHTASSFTSRDKISGRL